MTCNILEPYHDTPYDSQLHNETLQWKINYCHLALLNLPPGYWICQSLTKKCIKEGVCSPALTAVVTWSHMSADGQHQGTDALQHRCFTFCILEGGVEDHDLLAFPVTSTAPAELMKVKFAATLAPTPERLPEREDCDSFHPEAIALCASLVAAGLSSWSHYWVVPGGCAAWAELSVQATRADLKTVPSADEARQARFLIPGNRASQPAQCQSKRLSERSKRQSALGAPMLWIGGCRRASNATAGPQISSGCRRNHKCMLRHRQTPAPLLLAATTSGRG